MRSIAALLPGLMLSWAVPAHACNPEPPVPPILEGHEYDDTAREYLARLASTVAVGRYSGKLDLQMQGDDTGTSKLPDYLFELREGWKTPLRSRLVVPGYWVSCDLPLQRGAAYLFYLDGETPLFIIPAEWALDDLDTFGDLDWFYTASGQLIRPDILPQGEEENPSGEPRQ